jgi:hypothetical protein
MEKDKKKSEAGMKMKNDKVIRNLKKRRSRKKRNTRLL